MSIALESSGYFLPVGDSHKEMKREDEKGWFYAKEKEYYQEPDDSHRSHGMYDGDLSAGSYGGYFYGIL